jgi:hypothetical protein
MTGRAARYSIAALAAIGIILIVLTALARR